MARHTRFHSAMAAAATAAALSTAANAATSGPGACCAGDANGDRVVDFADLNICLSQFGRVQPGQSADFNGDGRVDFLDLNILLSNYARVYWGVSGALNPAGDIVIRVGSQGSFTYTLQNLMPTLPQTVQYSISKTSGPSALFITPGNGQRQLTPGQHFTGGAQAFLQTPTDASAHSVITLNVVGQNGANAQAQKNVCVIPTGETNAWVGWAANPNATVGRWNGALTPANVNFNGRSVTEQDPGGGGPDSCHFNGSNFAAFTAITGGTWAVGANNVWGADFVGWFPGAVTYYRAQGRVPCSTSFPQRMEINCPNGDQAYQTNTLGCAMTATTVSSTRSGTTQTKNWP